MATYFAFTTKEGLDAIAWCIANPPATVMFKEMAVGDLSGGSFPNNWAVGTAYTSGTVVVSRNKSLYTCISNHTSTALDEPGVVPPTANWATYWTLRTTLVNEQYRASVNAVYVHPSNPNWIVVEGIVPDDEGGWWISEVGLYADPGTGPVLFGVAKFPPSYKPVLASGSGKDFYIRIVLVCTDVSVINLIMDPSVVIATQTYVKNYAYWATEADRIWYGVNFEPGVTYNNAVYYNPITHQFGKALADGTIKQRVIGFADTVNNWVITHNDFQWGSPTLTEGSTYYLSTTTPGGVTPASPTRYVVKVGTARAIGTMMVDIDNILSGYEDIAFTSINSSGDVSLARDLSVGRNLSVVEDASIGRNLNVTNVLGVGSEAGFPAFQIDNSGNMMVTGGSDSIWTLSHSATPILNVTAVHILQILNNCVTPNDYWRFEWSTGRLLSPNTDFWVEGPDAPGPGAQGAGDVSVTGGTDGYFGFFHGPMPPAAQVKVWGITPAHELTINTDGFYYGAITNPNHMVNKNYVDSAVPGSYSYVFGHIARGQSDDKDLQYYAGWTKVQEIRTLRNGNFRITYGLYVNDGATGYVRLYKNGVAIGAVRTLTAPGGSSSNQWWTDDIAGWVPNDLIQIYGYSFLGIGPSAQALSSSLTVYADEDLITLL